MAHKWTPEERRKHLRDPYPEKRRAFGVLIAMLVLVIVIAAALGYATKVQADTGLVVILALALFASIILAVFLIDTEFYETW